MINLTYTLLLVTLAPLPLIFWLPHLTQLSLAWLASVLTSAPASHHDYIIIGSGSAGSTLAGRLAEAGHSVLLLEAGGPAPAIAYIPAMCGMLQNTPIDWSYRTEKQTESHLAYGGVSNWPRGKVLGGSSILNYMLYMRGHSQDYDEWRDLGLEGWGWEDVLPYFKRAENMESKVGQGDKYHGTGGPLSVTMDNFKVPVIDLLMRAARELGYKVGDVNGELEDEGFNIAQHTIRNGERTGTFRAYAEQYSGSKITVLTFAHVNKVIFRDNVAVGVEVSRFGRIDQYYAKQEVILSAGTIGTPQILMLSGIGDNDHLKEIGIKTILHSPEVGRNLQDHLLVGLSFDTREATNTDILASTRLSSWTSYLSGEGPLTSPSLDGVAQISTKVNEDTRGRPDIQLHLLGLSMGTDYGLVLRHNVGIDDEMVAWSLKHSENFSSSIMPTLNRPKSRGFIKLRSSDPQDYPIIQPNYLTVQHDVDTLVAGLNKSLEILDTKVMVEAGARVWPEPMPHCKHLEFLSQAYLECFVRHGAGTVYHHVGTCAMGTVLDNKMKVKGIERLRVVDGSAMPLIVGGNTNAPIIMMAEKAADMIINDYDKRREIRVETEKNKVEL